MRRVAPLPLVLLAVLAVPTSILHAQGGAAAPPAGATPAAQVPAALNQLKLFWLSVGNRDALYWVAHGVHTYATERGVPHIWRVDANAHDTAAMSANFFHIAQKLFKE